MNKQKFSFFVFVGLLLLNLCSFSQAVNTAKLDSLFNSIAEHNKGMGSVCLSRNGNVIYSKTIGYSYINGPEKTPATDKTKYRIGSITKMFTATIIFQLIEEGKLSLTTTIDKYFPSLPNAKIITVSNLLDHRSGLYDFTRSPDYSKWLTQPKTHDEIVALIAAGKPEFAPDEKAYYCNSNYVLLGYIIEDICKKPYKDVLNERIVSKAGLTNTYFGSKTDLKNNESYSYQLNDTWKQMPETDMSIPGGAGSIVSTPADLNKFITALFTGKLVGPASLTQMTTLKDDFGMGMFQIAFKERKAWGHNGGIDGFSSMLEYFTYDSVALAYCTNGQVYPMNDILLGVLDIYYNKPFRVPLFKTLNLTTEELDKYLGVYSSKDIPLKITITKDNTTLVAQATGQSSFPLEATEKNIFSFDKAGVILVFNPGKEEMILKQGGGTALFSKDK